MFQLALLALGALAVDLNTLSESPGDDNRPFWYIDLSEEPAVAAGAPRPERQRKWVPLAPEHAERLEASSDPIEYQHRSQSYTLDRTQQVNTRTGKQRDVARLVPSPNWRWEVALSPGADDTFDGTALSNPNFISYESADCDVQAILNRWDIRNRSDGSDVIIVRSQEYIVLPIGTDAVYNSEQWVRQHGAMFMQQSTRLVDGEYKQRPVRRVQQFVEAPLAGDARLDVMLAADATPASFVDYSFCGDKSGSMQSFGNTIKNAAGTYLTEILGDGTPGYVEFSVFDYAPEVIFNGPTNAHGRAEVGRLITDETAAGRGPARLPEACPLRVPAQLAAEAPLTQEVVVRCQESLTPGGGTNLLDSVWEAINRQAQRLLALGLLEDTDPDRPLSAPTGTQSTVNGGKLKPGVKAIFILLTDGAFNYSSRGRGRRGSAGSDKPVTEVSRIKEVLQDHEARGVQVIYMGASGSVGGRGGMRTDAVDFGFSERNVMTFGTNGRAGQAAFDALTDRTRGVRAGRGLEFTPEQQQRVEDVARESDAAEAAGRGSGGY